MPLHPDSPEPLDEKTLEAIRSAAADSLSPGTRRAYRSAWHGFDTWGRDEQRSTLPAAPATVAAYLVHLADRELTPSSLDRALAAIRAMHLDSRLPDPTSDRAVARVRSGLRRRLGTAPRRPSHPLTTGQVAAMVATCDRSSLRGCRDAAIILIGYAAALRRSEIAALRAKDILQRAAGIVVSISRSKSDQEGKGAMVGVVHGSNPDTDPVAAVLAWIEMSGARGSDPLFVPISWSNRWQGEAALSPAAIASIITGRAKAAGLGHLGVTAHSLRSGHATTAAEAGVAAERLARTTRHANLATLALYTRPADTLRDTSSSSLGL